jgi:hypothetical protein
MPDIFLCRARSFQSNLYYLMIFIKSVLVKYLANSRSEVAFFAKAGSFAMAFFKYFTNTDFII